MVQGVPWVRNGTDGTAQKGREEGGSNSSSDPTGLRNGGVSGPNRCPLVTCEVGAGIGLSSKHVHCMCLLNLNKKALGQLRYLDLPELLDFQKLLRPKLRRRTARHAARSNRRPRRRRSALCTPAARSKPAAATRRTGWRPGR